MGTCLSKKKEPIVSIPSTIPLDQTKPNSKTEQQEAEHKTENPIITEKKKQEEQDPMILPKKEIFIIKHRKSHDSKALTTAQTTPTTSIEEPEKPQITINNNNVPTAETKIEEVDVDAILIQCGRLSRSSSGKAGSRKYAGSKRSFDFDAEDCTRKQENSNNVVEEDEDYNGRRRYRSRESRASPSRRRRTPSREREQQQQQQQVSQQRSGSRERSSSSSNGGRRVSRSPGRRSENPINSVSAAAENGGNRPGKMVSVPASVDSGTGSIRRISVKRNVGSPRSQSPAKVAAAIAACNEKQPSLSRSNSRKAEQSPYRRNPMGEIDQNNNSYKVNKVQRSKDVEADLGVKEQSGYRIQAANQKPNVEVGTNKILTPVIANKINRPTIENNKTVNAISRSKEQLQHQIVEDAAEANTLQPRTVNYVAALPSTLGGEESLKPQALTRSRSARRSRDLDINPESLLNPNPSYTTLLLEDIQNFHQKSNPDPAPAPALTPNPKSNPSFSLPPCVTKAQSILEAVADLNSCTSSNLSSVFSDDKKCNKNDTKRSYPNDPFVESEVGINDDLMEPSFQKYVTVRRGIVGGDMEEQESSGSNSFVGSQHHWNCSGWEPNSADSTDCWTSRLKEREEEKNVLGLEEARKGFSGRRRDDQRLGIGQGRIGGARVVLAEV